MRAEAHRHPFRREEGLSLVELLVAISLVGFVLAAAWAFLFSLTRATSVNEGQTLAVHDFGDPLELISKLVMQETSIATAGHPAMPAGFNSYARKATTYDLNPGKMSITFWTNRKPPQRETSSGPLVQYPCLEHIYVTAYPASTSPGDLVWDSWDYNPAKTAVKTGTVLQRIVLIRGSNTNVLNAISAFRYFDDGVELNPAISTDLAKISSSATRIQATLAGLTSGLGTQKDTREIMLRNR